jgi:hypothetical protein
MQTWLQGELIVRGDKLGLDELPAALLRKHTLRELVLSHNCLTFLTPDIGKLKQLQVSQDLMPSVVTATLVAVWHGSARYGN